ncbi:hypothetical protein LEUCIP111803_01689 [Leucobacter soli]|uniref:DUF5979 domain-containing protein n=1 Tax=Leucobacter soli TaxID=2812850 RepID=A0A916NW20_9MICO|nr:hypothetical protein LEUCIP111803_01689 [Leucobacter soli]
MSAVAATAMAAGMFSAAILPAQAADPTPPVLEITKSVIVDGVEYDVPVAPEVEIGEEFQWRIEVVCHQYDEYCVNATLTDVIPDEFDIVTNSINSSATADISVSGQTVSIAFQVPLTDPAGSVGLSAGATVLIPVKLKPIDQSNNGRVISNSATIAADNADSKSDDAEVTAIVPLVVLAEATKNFDPTTTLATPGEPIDLTFGGINQSNGAVDRLVIQDPADPAADPNIFQQYLQIESLEDTAWPEGATEAVVSVTTDGTTWTAADPVTAEGDLALPTGIDPHAIRGIRIAFTAPNAAIPANAATSVQLALSQRSTVTGIASDTTLTNTSTAQTGVDTSESPVDEQDAGVVLRPAGTSVTASKSFSPDEIAVVGETTTSTVTLGATNSGTIPLSSLTINEPSDPADLSSGNLLAPAFSGGGVTFQGFGAAEWPHEAQSVEITYYFDDGSTETLTSSVLDEIPAATDPAKRVTGFSITFTGDIVESAEATVPFTVEAPPSLDLGQRTVTGTNEITVTGETPGTSTPNPDPDTADDDLTIFAEQINLTTEKTLTHDELWAVPGQSTTAQLTTTIAEYPYTTTNPTEVIVDDPSSLGPGVEPWYEYFDATAITLTQIPQNATLTVQYRDAAGDFHDIPGMVGISGATNGIFSASIPAELREDIVGIRFIYRSDDGFTPGQTLKSNVTFTTRADERTSGDPIPSSNADPDDDTPIAIVENCSAAEASAGTLESDRAVVDPPCPTATLNPIGPGSGPDIEKDWDPNLAFSHSRQNTAVTLNWSVGGVQGLDQVIIADSETDPATGAPAQLGAASAFDAFNLTAIGPITDPGFAFDQVQVQLYNGSDWVDTTVCTAAAPCSGTTIPVINLTTTEQATTQAVRFIVTEKPGRTQADPSDPAAGTGVSLGGGRQIPLTLQLRDALRSDANHPVVEGPTYNTGVASQVRNTSSIEGYVGGDREYRDADSETITITDTELGVSTSKTWAGGPIAIPQDWDAQDPPSTRVTLSATNQTVGGNVGGQDIPGLVNELRITEPGAHPGDTAHSPFEAFDLTGFYALTAPLGTTGIRVEFAGAGAPADVTGTTAANTLAALQALDPNELRNATGVTVVYTGSISAGTANGTGTVAFDLELREDERTSGDPVTTADSPVRNTVLGTVSDKRWDDDEDDFTDETLSDDASAQVQLNAQNISVTPGKTFNPTTESEPNNNPITMTLSGTPGGTERTIALTLTDDRATFWNAYDYLNIGNAFNLPSFAPNANPLQVQFSVCTGRDFETWEADGALATAGCEATGGTWSAWSAKLNVTQARAWAPADASAVEGIRIRITRDNDTQWQNPAAPTINVPIMVERRVDLRTGDPVPSTLNDGGSAAPGEPTKGVTVNTVRADVVGAWGGTANNSVDRSVTYQHANNAVEVQKQPTGVKSPGTLFDYTLTVRNTGARDIIDPVITDRLPWNSALGTLVQFDPDDEDTSDNYTYALSGTNPTEGTPMPTDAAQVAVAEDLASSSPTIAFTFAPGTRLAPGQTYTITFKMMFVAGVTEGLPVTNSFDISADRVWDACTAPTGSTATLSGDATSCATTATVTPQRLAAIRAVKSVRANGGDGSFNDHGFVDPAVCTPTRVDADEFVYQPCVPRTMPGQTEDWRLTVTNTGTTPLTRLVVADLLPTPGDTTLMVNFVRNSQWTPTLTGAEPTASMSFTGGTLTSYATTAAKADICMSVISNPTDANLASCLGSTAADAATKFIPFTMIEDYADVTALLFVVETADGMRIQPGQVTRIDFETETGPYSQQTADADPQAHNSLTVSARYLDGTAVRSLTGRDQSNVGVALITGSVRIQKLITGDAAGFVPSGQVFTGTLECTSQGVEIPDRSFTVVAGTPTVIDHLPAGAVCTATETAASGQTSYGVSAAVTVPDGRTVAAPADLPALTITNVYELTELAVRKTVDTDADEFPTGFSFTASCTFLGQPIELDPDDAEFTLDHDGEHVISGLPVNASCTITETGARGADSTTVEAESLDSEDEPHGTVVESGTSATITGLARIDGTNSVEFTNVYGEQAAVRVEKSLVGGAADIAADKSFVIEVLCTFEGETLLDTTLTLHRGNGWGETLSSLVAGAECTITEPSLNGADEVIITPNDGTDTTTGTITIPTEATEPVLVDVTNRFLAGSLEVTKSVTGDGAQQYGTGDFTVTLVCTLDDETVRVIDGADRTVSAADPVAEYTGLPNGAECTLTETSTAGATESRMRLDGDEWTSIDPGITFTVVADPAETADDDQAQAPIEVENRFDLAEVSVTKTVESDAVDADGESIGFGPFEIQLGCTFLGEPIEVADAVRSIEDGETVTWIDLPAGAICAAEETDTADADEVWFAQLASDSTEVRTDGAVLEFAPLVAVGGEDANEAELVNRFDSTALTIAKVVDGDDAASAAGAVFEFELVCTLTDATRPDGAEVWNGTLEVSAATDWRAEVPALATGAECEIVETETGGANRTAIAIDGERIGGDSASFTADETEIELTVTNTFRADLLSTGAAGLGALGALALLALVGGMVAILVARRRRETSGAE